MFSQVNKSRNQLIVNFQTEDVFYGTPDIYRGILFLMAKNDKNGLNWQNSDFFSKFYVFFGQNFKFDYFREIFAKIGSFCHILLFFCLYFHKIWLKKIQYGPFLAWNQILMVIGKPSGQDKHFLKILWSQLLSSRSLMNP